LLTLLENMPNGPADCRPKNGTLRAVLLSGAALAFLIAWVAPADAYRPKMGSAAKKSNPEGFGEAAKNGVLQIVVSIGSQRVTLFSDGKPVAQGTVSTGTPGHLTPMGVFSVIQKDRYHHSNLYGNAPMYYMQRITWSGVAMHQGAVTGRPASHGCIRLTHGFAAALWPTTKLGVRVVVARNDLAPVDIEHALLFTPRPKPSEPAIEMAKPSPSDLLQVAESTGTSKDAGALNLSQGVGEPAKPAGSDVDPAKPGVSPKAAPQPPKLNGQVAVFVSRKEGKVSVRQNFVPLFDMPVQIDEPGRPLGTHVFTAMGTKPDGSGMRWNVITIPTQPGATVEKRRSTRGKSKEPAQPTIVQTTPPSTATQALDRIHLPQEAVDRIADLLVPGSSLLVSDQGASGETGRGTEFIVLTR
jgi:L,D-transpeptidase-like protein